MRRFVLHMVLFFAVAVASASCGDRTKIISKSDMMDIYVDMYLADQWFIANPKENLRADTMLVYEPVFRKYGYDTDDFRESVFHYLSDPKRYARMLSKVAKRLETMSKNLEQYQLAIRQGEDAIKKLRFDPGLKLYYDSLFFANTDVYEINVIKDSMGRYLPEMKWLEPAVDTLVEAVDSTGLKELSPEDGKLDVIEHPLTRINTPRPSKRTGRPEEELVASPLKF